jgi:dipeptidyl aminopeptidase/acylaminoacyl peptidase
MRYKGRAALLAAVVLVFAGCMRADEEVSIPPLSAAEGHADPGLGPGTHPLSSGPGYKGSPSWSPQEDRIAYTVDGYVVDKPLDAGATRRWVKEDFVAEDVEWTSEDSLAILGSSVSEPVAGTDEGSLYGARSQEGSLDEEEVARKVLVMSPGHEGEGLIVAQETGPRESELALMQSNGTMQRTDAKPIEGRVTGISLSPDGRRAALAVRAPGDRGPSELHVLDLREGSHRRITRLRQDLEILGAPQWTTRGICYVAGKGEIPGGGSSTPLYDLYLLPPGSDTPEHTPGMGEDFIASGIRVSPDGGRLAVIGRLNPNSPINLYVLDLEEEDLEALTSNEDMEIKTGPDDLAWSPDGESVAIVARGALSEEPRVRAAPADTLLEDFYNVYEIPVEQRATP